MNTTTHTTVEPAPANDLPTSPAPKQKNWFLRHKVISGLMALVVIGGIASAAGGGSAEQPGATPAAATLSQQAQTPKADDPKSDTAAPGIGQKVRDGKFEFTVDKVKSGVTKIGGELFNEKAQGQFVLVDITVANIGEEPQHLSDSNMRVLDAKGREFSTDSSASMHLEDNQVFFEEINPGNTVKGTLVFDMPKGATPVSIELHDSMLSGGVTVRLK